MFYIVNTHQLGRTCHFSKKSMKLQLKTEEPYAGKPHVRICEGLRLRGLSLLDCLCIDDYLELRRCLMKTVLLHGLGQTAQDWKEVVQQLSISDVDCPKLFSSAEDEISYSQILGDLEQRYSEVKEPLRICGLSLGALLAIDFAIRHEEKVASLILIGAQYKVPSLLIDFQNLIFRCMPNKAFESMGLSKSSTIKLAHSMRSLDFTSQLNNIRCPVTILCGKKDTANLKASKRLKELLPKATLHIVPNAGHELNKYAPNTIAEILNN